MPDEREDRDDCSMQRPSFRCMLLNKNLPAIMGQRWLQSIQLQWQEVQMLLHDSNAMQVILVKHKEVFCEELGSMEKKILSSCVCADSKPVFNKTRLVPSA